MTDPIPNFGGFTDWRPNTGECPRTDADVDVVLRSEVRSPASWRSDPMHPTHWRWDIDGSEDVLFWRYVNPDDADRKELAERAARILGTKANGSPTGDLAAALDEVERLRRDLMLAVSGDEERLHDAVAAERAAVVQQLRTMADAADKRSASMLGVPNEIDRAQGYADGLAEAFRVVLAGEHRNEDPDNG